MLADEIDQLACTRKLVSRVTIVGNFGFVALSYDI